MATSLDIATLQNPFQDQLSFGLAKKVYLGMDSLDNVEVLTDVNGALILNTVKPAILLTNATCNGLTPTGTTQFIGNTLSTCSVGTEQALCLQDLQRTYYGKFQAASVRGATDLGTYQDFIMTTFGEALREKLEYLIWQGSNAASSASWMGTNGYALVNNNIVCNGWLQAGYVLSATCAANVVRSGLTTANAIAYVDNAYANATAAMKTAEDLTYFCSPEDFDVYLGALRQGNYYHGTLDFTNITEIQHLGSRNLKVKIANGLNLVPSGTFILTYKQNIVFGTLAEQDFMGIDGIYDPYAKLYRITPRANIGTQFVFAEHLVRSRD